MILLAFVADALSVEGAFFHDEGHGSGPARVDGIGDGEH